jgi:hypothetical protein
MNVQGLSVSRHARDRFQEHHPDATSNDEIKTHVRYGVEVDGAVVAAALCWQMPRPGSTYVLAPDRQGIFVIAENDNTYRPRTLVTYLRLGQHHQDWAHDQWPTDYEG